MQFPYAVESYKRNFSNTMQFCYESPTEYMPIEAEKKFASEALEVVITAVQRKQMVLQPKGGTLEKQGLKTKLNDGLSQRHNKSYSQSVKSTRKAKTMSNRSMLKKQLDISNLRSNRIKRKQPKGASFHVTKSLLILEAFKTESLDPTPETLLSSRDRDGLPGSR